MTVNRSRLTSLALLIALAWTGCKRPQPFAQTGAPAVTVAKPQRESVAPSIDLTGTVAPFRRSIWLRAFRDFSRRFPFATDRL